MKSGAVKVPFFLNKRRIHQCKLMYPLYENYYLVNKFFKFIGWFA